jgi:hypothetical protein
MNTEYISAIFDDRFALQYGVFVTYTNSSKIHSTSNCITHDIYEPACIHYGACGNVSEIHYYENFRLHNQCGPASVKYNTNGSILYIAFYTNDTCDNRYQHYMIIWSERNNTITAVSYNLGLCKYTSCESESVLDRAIPWLYQQKSELWRWIQNAR